MEIFYILDLGSYYTTVYSCLHSLGCIHKKGEFFCLQIILQEARVKKHHLQSHYKKIKYMNVYNKICASKEIKQCFVTT